MARKSKAYGYFWGGTWQDAKGENKTDEIALNPDHLRTRSAEKSLSTLVHEMVHLEQHHYGKPSRNGYHNKEWANFMVRVGLIPSDTGEKDGKMTGQRVGHYIEEGGLFEKACAELISAGFTIPWVAVTGDEARAKKKAESKTKYTCMECGTNAWAKPETRLICGACQVEMFSGVLEL